MNAREDTPRRYPGATMSRKACQMSARTVKVASASGLHARPAALFSQAASEQPAAVTIETADAGPVKASSILMLLTLDVAFDDEVTLRAEGEGADDVLANLCTALETPSA